MTWQVIEADCVEAMKEMEVDSVDAVVTDPPAGISFMGRGWDSDRSGGFVAWLASVMEEALRVTKPGGHALVWALPRTSHWTGSAVEAAGWEIRDRISHHFGSGFPKSHNLGNGFGTALKPATEDWWLARKPLIGTVAQTVSEFGTGALNIDGTRIGYQGKADQVSAKPGGKATARSGALAGKAQADEGFVIAGPEVDGERLYWSNEDGWGSHDTATIFTPDEANLPDPEDATAREWLSKRTEFQADNTKGRWPANVALSHLPECERVGERRVKGDNARATSRGLTGGMFGDGSGSGYPGGYAKDGLETVEAWSCAPGCAVAELDRQSGELKSGSRAAGDYGRLGYQGWDEGPMPAVQGDVGHASRFFYCAKSSRSERNAGLEGFEERPATERFRGERESSFSDPRMDREQERRPAANVHPTVKPVELMRWLVRLVCPPDGTVLDCFAGSGTTGIACVLEDFDFIGIERDESYCAIARARIDHWARQPKQLDLLDAA